jgi:N-formylglutamate amidohydrolase
MYFTFEHNENSPIVCNIPHAGLSVPTQCKESFTLSEEKLTHEVSYMADMYTDELYGELAHVASFIKPTISRVVVDVERFENEDEEPMARVGMSAFYTKTSGGELLRTINQAQRKELETIYHEYHETFTTLVEKTLASQGRAIIVDCHSFPSVPRVYEPDQELFRPDICIGTDSYHTPQELTDFLVSHFTNAGYSVKINSPFAGTIVPMSHYHKDGRVVSVMIEVNRKLYMNEETFERSEDFSSTARTISRCVISALNQFYSSL